MRYLSRDNMFGRAGRDRRGKTSCIFGSELSLKSLVSSLLARFVKPDLCLPVRGGLRLSLGRASRRSGNKGCRRQTASEEGSGITASKPWGLQDRVTTFLEKVRPLPSDCLGNASFQWPDMHLENAHQPKEKMHRSQFEMSGGSV
jgi:hypothetical protein